MFVTYALLFWYGSSLVKSGKVCLIKLYNELHDAAVIA
jgi:hypothetical protein